MHRSDPEDATPHGFVHRVSAGMLNPSARTLAPGDWVGGLSFPMANDQTISGGTRQLRYFSSGTHPGAVHLG